MQLLRVLNCRRQEQQELEDGAGARQQTEAWWERHGRLAQEYCATGEACQLASLPVNFCATRCGIRGLLLVSFHLLFFLLSLGVCFSAIAAGMRVQLLCPAACGCCTLL